MTESTTPIARDGFRTTDPGVANQALARMYGDVRSWVYGDSTGFTYEVRSGAAPSLATARMRFTMGFGIDAELNPDFHTFLVMYGGLHYDVTTALGSASLTPGDVAVIPAGAGLRVSLEALDVATLSLAAADVSRTAFELYGCAAEDFKVLDMEPAAKHTTRYWHRTLSVVSGELLANDPALEHPLVMAETQRSLCATFLHLFPTTVDGRGRVGGLTPRALRRAIAFIDINAAAPITLSDIAAAAGTSPRALQQAFSRYRDTTPMSYLRRVRLERAHDELRLADPSAGAQVADIARRWGFAKPGRFAAAYRAVFGVAPSTTLRR